MPLVFQEQRTCDLLATEKEQVFCFLLLFLTIKRLEQHPASNQRSISLLCDGQGSFWGLKSRCLFLFQDFSYDDSKVEFNVDAPNGVVMEGYLFKRASNAFKTWNR